MFDTPIDPFPDDPEDENSVPEQERKPPMDGSAGQRKRHETIREDLIAAVRKRLDAKFYQSEAVIEDLSETFASAIDQTC